jgi:anti-sigma factor ChrR (cupin superfamily)
MNLEQQQELASLYVAGALTPAEQEAFEAELRNNAQLRELVRGLSKGIESLASASPTVPLPAGLKNKVLERIEEKERGKAMASALTGFRFLAASDQKGWKQLPVPGAWIKLLSLEPDRGYAVLLGRLDPGVRYPAHTNAGPEDFYILTGDLHIGDRKLNAGDFHHADAESLHEESYSKDGCTLLAVLTTNDPLVAFAMS